MVMLKSEKIELVAKLKAELKSHKTIAILPIESLPDSLLQRVRNQIAPDSKVFVARKTLLNMALKEAGLTVLDKYVNKNVAVIVSNSEPTELNRIVQSNKLRLGAKPNQVSPADISIEPGDTSIAPGQTVTDLKAAGIDVKIDKGKVVISKGKVLVAKGSKISGAVANALKILDIKPFEVMPRLSAALYEKLLFGELALSIDEAYSANQVLKSFLEANALSTAIGMVTEYNVSALISKAFNGAMALGLEAKAPSRKSQKCS